MNEIIEIFTANAESFLNIQPFVYDSWLINLYIAVSFLLLTLAALSSITYDSNFFASMLPFLFSEQNSLSIYRSKTGITPTEILLGIFFIIQLSTFLFLGKFSSLKVLYLAILCLLLLLFKFFIYRSLQWLLSKRVEIDYYGFNYIYICLFFGLVLFFVNLYLIINPSLYKPEWALVLASLFYTILVIRLITISLRYKIIGNLYIFLYFCTLEIAPIIIMLSYNKDWGFN